MDINLLFGYIGALSIGIVLGLIGGGGSILTVPILVYLLAINPVLATAYSLFVVGVSSLFGALRNAAKGLVDFKVALIFSVPAFIAVYIARKFLVPSIPESIFQFNSFELTKNIAIMVFFAIIMLLAALSMISNNQNSTESEKTQKVQYNYPIIMIKSFFVGIITGIVGAGGGFLFVPSLIILAKLPMKKAVATSLLIIGINSLIGFTGDLQYLEIDWSFLLSFTIVAIVGIFMGMWLSKFIEGKKLKAAFGWFVLCMAIYIIFKELL